MASCLNPARATIGPRPGTSSRKPAGRAVSRGAALCLAASVLVLFAGEAAGGPRVTRHDLSVWLSPEFRSITARDTVTVRTGGAPALVFDLFEGATGISVAAGGRRIPFARENGRIRVDVPPDLAEDGEWSLTISYRGTFRDPVPEDPLNTEDPSYGVRGTIGERGTFLGAGAGWYPEIPGSLSTFRLRVEGPAGYEAVTSGALLRRETACGITRSEWESRNPLPGLFLSAGPYVVRESDAGGIPLYTYFYPGTDPLAEKYLEAAGGYLALYRDLLGPYPFEKFAVVENFLPTGYGFPSYTLLGSSVVRLPFIVETSLGHEVAHSWFGNGVRVDPGGGNWSEGLTTYLADHYYKERASAREGREYRLKILRDYATLVPPESDFPLSSFTGRASPATRAVGYGKAAMVFHMARRAAGEDGFWTGLRAVVRERMFRQASWDDFARAFGKESGIDFAPFFRQWTGRAGAPVFALRDVAAERDGTGWRVSGRIVQEKPHFDLRVPLRLATEGGETVSVVELLGPEAPFSLAAKARPLKLSADPDVDLFRRLHPSEIPPTVNSVRGSTDLLVVASAGLPGELLEASKVLLAAMGREDARVVREEDASVSGLKGRDVLFLGLPKGPGFLPALPPELSAQADRFLIDGAVYGSPGDALFAVLPHPSDEGRVAALFLAFSPQAAAKAARKIPHYGKYSFLAFSEGTNRGKGTWEPSSSPLIRVFPGAPPQQLPKVPAAPGR